jgi:hypothetical protein
LPYLLADADPVKLPSRSAVEVGAVVVPGLVVPVALEPPEFVPDVLPGAAGTVTSGIDEVLDEALLCSRYAPSPRVETTLSASAAMRLPLAG